jgi:outer membrane protein
MRWLILAFLLFSNILQADFLKAEVGAGIWNIQSSGEVAYHGSPLDLQDDLGLDSTLSAYVWANFKHFIPVIPNARVEVTRFGTDATKYIPKGSFDYVDLNNTNINSKLNLDQIDAILYYNLWDTFILFDVGVGIKYYTGSIDVANSSVEVNIPIPIIYGRIGADIPFTNVGAEMDLKYFKFSPLVNAEMFDLRIKAKATILTIAVLDLNIEAGYRVHRLQILASGKNSFAGFNADIKTEISGFFGGINIAF